MPRRRVLRSVEHRQSTYLNNRAENSHQPTRQRERAMKKFNSPGSAQRFLGAFSGISLHFRTRRHRLRAQEYRSEIASCVNAWNEVAGLPTAARQNNRVNHHGALTRTATHHRRPS